MPPATASSPDLRHVDPRIWQACAGTTVDIPAVNSRIYYFPQGHLEQSSSPFPAILSPLSLSKPYVVCLVTAISFHADPITDEVFAKLELHPVVSLGNFSTSDVRFDSTAHEEHKITSFAKVLTASDANNGGGFSVPRYCAESIFPPLDLQEDPPVQILVVKDIHGDSWTFRHIYRGSPRRHLLTTGWSKFVNMKKLVAGDSALFMKNAVGEVFVGIRRSASASDAGDCSQWRMQTGAAKVKIDDACSLKGGFSRAGGGRVPIKSIVNAIEMSARGYPFEVIYYPRSGWSDFIVKADLVEAAMRLYWTPGLRVKMAVETDDTSRITWFQGTVSSTSVPDKGSWQGSPWRMVQVQWDEPEVLWKARFVNPWQVEVVLTSSSPSCFTVPPAKRLRSASVHTNSEYKSERSQETHFSISGFISSTMDGIHLSHPLMKNNICDVGIQGTRQDAHVASTFVDYYNGYTSPTGYGAALTLETAQKMKTVSTELSICCSSENLSPDSLSSGLSSETPKVVPNSIKLFGELICMEKSGESGSDNGCCVEDDGSRDSTQVGHSPNLSWTGHNGKLPE